MKSFVSQSDIIEELHNRTDIYRKDLRFILDALEDVIIDMMSRANKENPSEIRLFHGWKLGAKILPEREAKNPKTGETIIIPEKMSPYCRFEQTFKKKLNDM